MSLIRSSQHISASSRLKMSHLQSNVLCRGLCSCCYVFRDVSNTVTSMISDKGTFYYSRQQKASQRAAIRTSLEICAVAAAADSFLFLSGNILSMKWLVDGCSTQHTHSLSEHQQISANWISSTVLPLAAPQRQHLLSLQPFTCDLVKHTFPHQSLQLLILHMADTGLGCRLLWLLRCKWRHLLMRHCGVWLNSRWKVYVSHQLINASQENAQDFSIISI